MKPLFFLLSFALIVALGVTCVGPILKEYIEGELSFKAKVAIEEDDQYSVKSLKMDHFHAKKAVIETVLPVSAQNIEKVKTEIIGKIDPILGIYAQDFELVLKNSDAGLANKEKIEEEQVVTKIPEPGPPPPSEMPDKAIVREPARFSVLWKSKDQELLLKGKQTNKRAGMELINYFKEAKKKVKESSSIEIDNQSVANSMYLHRTLKQARLIILNSDGDLSIDFQDAIKSKEDKQKGFVKFKGTTGTLEQYKALSASMKSLESDDFEIQNQLAFYPYVSIKKDALKEKIILSGYVKDKLEQAMLGSNAARNVTSNFTTDNQLDVEKRSLVISWHDEHAENLIARHMENVVEGEIIYRNNKLHSLSGVSHNAKFVSEVKEAFKGTDIVKKLIFKESPKKQITLVEPEPARPESLSEQLDDYKIYFDSGKSQVDPKFNAELDEMAQKIKASSDKESQIIVGGYADTSGSADQNKILSLKRARSVMTKLVRKGVDASRIQIEFFGAEANGKSKAESRRVEIKVRKK